MSTIQFDVYRKEGSVEGTTKDWAIGIAPEQGLVIIKYGRTGKKLKTSIVKTTNPHKEKEDRAQAKVRSGYFYQHSTTLLAEAKEIGIETVEKPNILWAINRFSSKEVLKERIQLMTQNLNKLNLPVPVSFKKGELLVSGKAIMDLNGIIKNTNGTFTIGGMIDNDDATLSSLTILSIATRTGNVTFSDDDNQPITVEYLGNETRLATPKYPLDLLSDIAIALELKKAAVNLYCSNNQGFKPLLQLNI